MFSAVQSAQGPEKFLMTQGCKSSQLKESSVQPLICCLAKDWPLIVLADFYYLPTWV